MGRINTGCTSGSVLGPMLFNIYLNDLFLLVESTEICNFADDTTFFACENSLINRLEHDSCDWMVTCNWMVWKQQLYEVESRKVSSSSIVKQVWKHLGKNMGKS